MYDYTSRYRLISIVAMTIKTHRYTLIRYSTSITKKKTKKITISLQCNVQIERCLIETLNVAAVSYQHFQHLLSIWFSSQTIVPLGSLVQTFDLNHNFRYLVKTILKC